MKTLCVGGRSDGSATCQTRNVNDGAAVQGYENRGLLKNKVSYCQPSVNPAKTSIVWPWTGFFLSPSGQIWVLCPIEGHSICRTWPEMCWRAHVKRMFDVFSEKSVALSFPAIDDYSLECDCLRSG